MCDQVLFYGVSTELAQNTGAVQWMTHAMVLAPESRRCPLDIVQLFLSLRVTWAPVCVTPLCLGNYTTKFFSDILEI